MTHAFDHDAIRTFLRQQFPLLEAGERIEIRAFPSRNGGTRFREFLASPDDAAAYITTHIPTSTEVYVGVNPRRGHDGTKEGVSRITWLWADMDYKHFESIEECEAMLDGFELRPTKIVRSGGGLQVYWAIAPVDATSEGQRVETLLRRLYLRLGNLDAVQDRSRILRVAGTWNNKAEYDEPRPVRQVFYDPSAVYKLEEFNACLPALPESTPNTPAPSGNSDSNERPSIEELRHILSFIPPTLPYTQYLPVWMGVASVYPGDDGRALIDEWSSDAREENGQYASPRTQPHKHRQFKRTGYKIGTVIYYAKQGGYVPPAQPTPQPRHATSQGTLTQDQWDAPIPLHRSATPPPFPVAALPDDLAEWVAEEAHATQTPPDLAGMLTLAALATAMGGKARVQVRRGWSEPLNLYTVIALGPANRKSAVFQSATAPIREYESSETKRLAPAVMEARSRQQRQEKTLRHAEDTAAKAVTETDRRDAASRADTLAREIANSPNLATPRLLADDVTPEKLKTLLAEQGGRMSVMSAEGGPFEMMAGRYSRNGSPNFEVYLKGHSGDEITVDRGSRPTEYVPAPALTLGVTVQPSVLRRLADTPAFRGQGLLARFLYSIPPTLVGSRDPHAAPAAESTIRSYAARLTALLSIAAPAQPHTITLSVTASERFMAFERWLEPQLAESAALGDMADWAGKLAGAVARIAALLHCWQFASGSTLPWEVPIDEPTIEAAITLGEYAIAHARAAFALMGADPVVEEAHHILLWVKRECRDQFTRRDLFEGVKGRFGRMDRLTPGLELLTGHSYIAPGHTPERNGPGRPPSPIYVVNPQLYSQYSHNSQN